MENTVYIYESESYNKTEYKKIRKILKNNDVLVVKSLSALGQTSTELQNELAYITKKVQADLVVLDIPMLDTRVNKVINGTLVVDLVIQMLSYNLKLEQTFRKQRQTEGIAQAKANGQKFGRPPIPYPEGFDKVYERIIANEITKAEGARELKITPHKMLRFVERRTRELVE